jgi:outer membrane protein
MKRLLLWMFCLITPLSIFAQEETITLDQCVDIALKRNNDIIQSNLQLKMYSRDEISALSRFLPSVSADLGYTHSVKGPSSASVIDPHTGIPVSEQSIKTKYWGSNAGLSARQMFFDGTSIFDFFRAKYLKNIAGAASDDTRQGVIFKVKEAYFNLLKKKKLLQVQEETLKSWEESYKRNDMMYQVGKVAKSDVLRAKVELENARLALIQAQNDLALANASLNYVLGFEVDRRINTLDRVDTMETEITYETALEKALANNPLLQKSRYGVSAAKAGIGSASSQFLPSIYASGSYSWNNKKLDQIKYILDKDYGWNLGVSLSIPIFQGFSRIAGVSKAQLQYKSSKEDLEQAKRDVALAVKQACAAIQLAKQQISVTQDAEAAAEEDLRLNKEKYELGSGTMLELIIAQTSYTKALSDHIQALYDYQTAYAQLEKSMGVLN